MRKGEVTSIYNAYKPGAYTIMNVGFHGMCIIAVGLVIAALLRSSLHMWDNNGSILFLPISSNSARSKRWISMHNRT